MELKNTQAKPAGQRGSLDGEPLATSRRILIQAGTEDKTYGFRTEPARDGRHRITALGGYPLNVCKIDAVVTIKRADLEGATVLDGNGYPTDRQAEARAGDGALILRLPEDELYTLVR